MDKVALSIPMATGMKALGFKVSQLAKEFISKPTAVDMKEISLMAKSMDTVSFNGMTAAITRADGFKMFILGRELSAGLMEGYTKGSGRTV
jgi:hypothetical protein